MMMITEKANVVGFADCPVRLTVQLQVEICARQFVNVRGVGYRVAYPTQVWKSSSEEELLRVFPEHADLIGLASRRANGEPMFHGRENSKYFADNAELNSLALIMRVSKADAGDLVNRYKKTGDWNAIYDEHAKRWAAAILDRYGVDQGSSDSASA
ncbi:MAG: hypothetical protein AB7U75_14690 [Hyphomicrobiaceae bacterium]